GRDWKTFSRQSKRSLRPQFLRATPGIALLRGKEDNSLARQHRCSHRPRLHRDSPGVVNALEKKPKLFLIDILIYCFSSTLPMTIVVNDQNTPDRKPRIEMD